MRRRAARGDAHDAASRVGAAHPIISGIGDEDFAIRGGTRRARPGLLSAAALAVLAAVFAARVALHRALEDTGDLFSFLQMSRDFTRGRPLLFENAFGNGAAVHSWFTVPLFFPLTAPLGARGLFLGLLLLFLAAVVALDTLGRRDPRRAGVATAAAVALFLGPVALWLVDDRPYGWNVELAFFPLAALFGSSLLRGSRSALLWGALLALNREDGPILAWGVHALHVWTSTLGEPRRARLRRLAGVTTLWLGVFALTLLALHAATAPGRPSRVASALRELRGLGTRPEDVRALASGFLDAGLLLATGLLTFLPWLTMRGALASAVCAAPVVIAVGMASLLYPGAGLLVHGPAWAPRFAFLWGFLAAAALLAFPPRRRSRGLVTALVALSLLAQWGVLKWRAGWALEDRFSPARLLEARGSPAGRLTARERAYLGCLADQLPRETVVMTNHNLFAIFERQDLVWPDHPLDNTWSGVFPQITVCDVRGRLVDPCFSRLRQLPSTGFARTDLEGLQLAYGSSTAEPMERCTQRPTP